MTKELLVRFAEVGSQQGNKDPQVIARFFNPAGAGTWYATEYDPAEEAFFGYVDLFGDDFCPEWRRFTLEELRTAEKVETIFVNISTGKSRRGKIGVERDRQFEEQPMSQVWPKALRRL